MIVRSLLASLALLGPIAFGSASAQVLLCPEAPPTDVKAEDKPSEAERLLKRLTIALDLHGHRGISEQEIMEAHAETPSALLAKLDNVVDRCEKAAGDLDDFYLALPEIRKAFLEATNIADRVAIKGESEGEAASNSSEAERIEEAIDLSVRELWRKLWFRSAKSEEQENGRFAVIVASPSDADSGWDELGRHQSQWKDAFFQLHIPYYDSNPHHAIVVGRRLPREQAEQLRDYAIEIGMAEDAYLWELPEDTVVEDGKEAAQLDDVVIVYAKDDRTRKELDLSILDR